MSNTHLTLQERSCIYHLANRQSPKHTTKTPTLTKSIYLTWLPLPPRHTNSSSRRVALPQPRQNLFRPNPPTRKIDEHIPLTFQFTLISTQFP